MRPPSPEAYEVASAWQLGEPLAEYQAAPIGLCLLLLASSGVFIALVACAVVSFSLVALAAAGLVLLAILGLWGTLSTRYKDTRYRRGEMVTFGPLSVNLSGIWVGSEMLAWSDISSIAVKDTTIHIKKQGSWLSWATCLVKEIPNVAIFASLVERVRSGQV